MSGWRTVDSLPERGTFMVYLAEVDGVMGSRFGVAMIHPNVSFVNGKFRFDAPAITHWSYEPEPPAELKESGS
jgi:hypothetical protein